MTFVSTPLRAAACSLLASISVSAFSQTLKETVVTASRVEQPLADVLPSVSVITRADIERVQATSLADLLQGEAGFEFGRNGGPGSTTSFFLRGADSTNLVIMVDGVKTMTDGYGNLSSIDLSLSQIERIELLRGNAGALYGEAAIGGVIQIFTRGFDKKNATYANASTGSRNSQSLSVGTVKTVEDTTFRLDAARERTDGFSAMNPIQKPNANPDKDGYENTTLSTKIAKNISRSLQLGVSVNTSQSNLGYDDSYYGVPTDTHTLKRENYVLNTFAQVLWSDVLKTRVDLTRAGLEYRDLKNGQPNPDFANYTRGEQNSLRLNNIWSFNSFSLVNFGLDASNDTYESNPIDNGGYVARRQSRGYFSGLTSQVGKFSWQANLRHDDIDGTNDDGQIKKSNWSADSFLLGLGYQLNETLRLTVSSSNGFRAPSAGELALNINLKPQKHQSQELGVTYVNQDALVRGVFFDTKTQDAFVYDVNPPYAITNIGKVRNQGFELTAKANVAGSHLKASYVTQDPYDETNQQRLARRARQYGSLEMWRLFGITTAGFRFLASDDRADEVVLPGYTTLGIYLSRPVTPEWTAKVKLENVTDRPYQLAYGYNTPGFGAFFSLTYQSK